LPPRRAPPLKDAGLPLASFVL